MDNIIITLIIILSLILLILILWYDTCSKSEFEDRMRNSDIYLELIDKIDATEFEEEEMLSSIHVHSYYIEVTYLNPKPKGRGHSFKIEIAADKFDMSTRHRKTLLKLVADYCIKDIHIKSYYNQTDYNSCKHNYITINPKIAQKYINSYKTPIC